MVAVAKDAVVTLFAFTEVIAIRLFHAKFCGCKGRTLMTTITEYTIGTFTTVTE